MHYKRHKIKVHIISNEGRNYRNKTQNKNTKYHKMKSLISRKRFWMIIHFNKQKVKEINDNTDTFTRTSASSSKVKCQLLARVPNIGQFFNTPHYRDEMCVSTATYIISCSLDPYLLFTLFFCEMGIQFEFYQRSCKTC